MLQPRKVKPFHERHQKWRGGKPEHVLVLEDRAAILVGRHKRHEGGPLVEGLVVLVVFPVGCQRPGSDPAHINLPIPLGKFGCRHRQHGHG